MLLTSGTADSCPSSSGKVTASITCIVSPKQAFSASVATATLLSDCSGKSCYTFFLTLPLYNLFSNHSFCTSVNLLTPDVH